MSSNTAWANTAWAKSNHSLTFGLAMLICSVIISVLCLVADLRQDTAINSAAKELEARAKQLRQCAFVASTYALEDASVDNLAELSGSKKLVRRVRVVRDGDVVIAEYLGETPGAELSPGNPLNEVSSVFAFNGTTYYEYVPIPSTGNPLANVNRFQKTDPRARLRLNDLLASIDPTVLAGQAITAFLVDPDIRLLDVTDDGFSLLSEGVKSEVTYKTLLKFASPSKPELVSVSIESVFDGVKTQMERRIDYQDFEGNRVPNKLITLFANGSEKSLEWTEVTWLPFKKPGKVDDEYFRRHQRLYSVSPVGEKVDKTIDGTPSHLQATYADRMANSTLVPTRVSYNIGLFLLLLIVALGCIVFWVKKRGS